jgi:hypothetical protein
MVKPMNKSNFIKEVDRLYKKAFPAEVAKNKELEASKEHYDKQIKEGKIRSFPKTFFDNDH